MASKGHAPLTAPAALALPLCLLLVLAGVVSAAGQPTTAGAAAPAGASVAEPAESTATPTTSPTVAPTGTRTPTASATSTIVPSGATAPLYYSGVKHSYYPGENAPMASVPTLLELPDGTVLAGSTGAEAGGPLLRRLPGADTWQPVSITLTMSPTVALTSIRSLGWLTPTLFVGTAGQGLYYCSPCTNITATSAISVKEALGTPVTATVRALLAAPADHAIYVGTAAGHIFRLNEAAGSYVVADISPPTEPASVHALALAADRLYAATENGLRERNVQTGQWSWTSEALRSSVGAVGVTRQAIYATGANNVYARYTGATSWMTFRLPTQAQAWKIAVHSLPTADVLLAGAWGEGIFLAKVEKGDTQTQWFRIGYGGGGASAYMSSLLLQPLRDGAWQATVGSSDRIISIVIGERVTFLPIIVK